MRWNPATQLAILSAKECSQVQATLHLLQPHWVVRQPGVPFYTLGAASYLDARQSFGQYRTMAERFNPVLQEHFAWLQERVRSRLAEHLGEPVECAPTLAPPGFHIYLACKLFEKPIASIHFDLQYALLQWPQMAECDFTRPLSFTLPIALPKMGGGLTTWELEYDDVRDETPAWRNRIAQTPQQYHAYTLGKLFVHSGHTLHQAAPGQDLQTSDSRITLQGHAIRCGGRWQMYW